MRLAAVVSTFLLATALQRDASPSSAHCEQLLSLAVPDGIITEAAYVPAGPFAPPVSRSSGDSMFLPAFCRVAATLKPTADSNIKIEVWMPASGWNGKFQGVGNGGWNGAITYPGLALALRQGYATGSTDTGHAGDTAIFAMGHPEKLVDFAYRAVHAMTVRAKAIVTAFYGKGPRISYWLGCSSGGRQGLKEAQRFPEDYDGIVAGAPANSWTRLATSSVWIAQATLKDPASYLPRAKFRSLHQAVLAACDTLDGVKDGVLENPMRCHFDPRILQCTGSDDRPSCLTATQVAAARKVYGGPVNPRTGEQIFPGLEPGSELGWTALAGGPKLGASAAEHFKFVVFRNPAWDFRTFDFDTDARETDEIDAGSINATDPDLKAFVARGGKLILYHGWSDPLIAPRSTIDYYTAVVAALGGPHNAMESVRLFLVPGMDHCAGGEGASGFDILTALEQWKEHSTPPDRITASRLAGGLVDRTRPLCPYPQAAAYTGNGSTDSAGSFTCRVP
jgi:feruloyl esterase